MNLSVHPRTFIKLGYNYDGDGYLNFYFNEFNRVLGKWESQLDNFSQIHFYKFFYLS